MTKRVAIGAFWALVGAVVSRGLTLVSSVLAARLLGASGFGELTMVQSTQGTLGVLAGAGMGLAATKFVAEHRSLDLARASRCAGLAIFVAAAAGLVAVPILLVFAAQIADRILHAPHLTPELQAATGLLFFGTLNGVQTGAVVGVGDFRMVAILSIVRGVFLCVFLLLGVVLGGVMGGVIGLTAAEAIAVVANHLALVKALPDLHCGWPRGQAARGELAAMCRFSLLALAASVVFTASLWYGNVVLVQQADGYAALGVFNAAERWRQLLLFLPATLSPLILSMLSNLHGTKDPTEYRTLVAINVWLNVGVVLLPSLGLAAIAPWAMEIFGDEYQAGSSTLIILAISCVPVVLNNVLGQVLVSQGAIWGRFVLDVLLASVLALVSWWLIPTGRDVGLAMANLIAYGVTAIALIPLVVQSLRRLAGTATGAAQEARP